MGASNPDVKTPYNPPSVTIPAGSIVKWINNDNSLHTVTSFTRAFDSGKLQPNQEFASPFYNSGVYKYYCQLHPYMNGAVIAN
ncbi:MAG: plastocyanin/azurin family copper-binding protein [Nitrososphaerales archaeon]